MKKAMRIPYNEMFEIKCGYEAYAGIRHFAANAYSTPITLEASCIYNDKELMKVFTICPKYPERLICRGKEG